jgi:glyoxylase-like metal-dependent hydrolase (beta-lactamase superfamily II)
LDYLLEKVNESIYVAAIWDEGWNSYNNCYLILEEDGVTVIDSCKKEHTDCLRHALSTIGKTPEDVKLVLATHGHEDHVEGTTIFTQAQKAIHPREQSAESASFDIELADSGTIHDFVYTLVGHHTPGSVVFYHNPSNTIFTGDFLCFFGDPLSKDGLVSKGDDLRIAWIDFLAGGGIPNEQLPVFLKGLKAIKGFDSEFMCTGHGGVLAGDINSFIDDLLKLRAAK